MKKERKGISSRSKQREKLDRDCFYLFTFDWMIVLEWVKNKIFALSRPPHLNI